MKHTLLIAALALAASPAMASKARLKALNAAPHLSDLQDVFGNASKVTQHGDWLTFEMGANPGANQNNPNTYTTPDAEGGFARAMGDASYGFYLGHHTTWVKEVRQPNAKITTTTYLTDENPINLFYGSKAGDMAWGVGLNYANSDKKSTKTKQSATGVNVGVTGANWDAALDLGLVNTYKNEMTGAEVDFKGKTAIGVAGTYTMDTMTFHANYSMNGGKDDTNNVDLETSNMGLGVVNSHKADGADFFYGVAYSMASFKEKTAGLKYEVSQLPVYAGIEADATSWMVLRGSVTQNFIVGSTKDEFTGGAGAESDTIANNTVVAAGAGLKFNKLMLDGTFSKASGGTATGELNGNEFLANAALTYKF